MVGTPIVGNDIALDIYAKQIQKFQPSAQVLDQYQICGKLNGCGNNMDFLAGVLVSTDLTQQAVYDICTENYENAWRNQGAAELVVELVSSNHLESEYLEFDQIVFDDAALQKSKGENHFAVFVFDRHEAGWDLRGH